MLIKVACIPVVLLLVIPLMGQEIQEDSCRGLQVEEFYIQLQSSVYPVLIDARTWDEFRKERISGAILAEDGEILAKIVDTLDLDQQVFIYCAEEVRSITACMLIRERGIAGVYYLHGGINGWKLSGHATDRKKLRRKRSEN